MEQTVYNLMTNASKFTPRGSSIILRAKRGEAEVVVEVEDSGIGILGYVPHCPRPYSNIF
ncbi:ATP-binding protein [Chloroflexota bacterium]